MDVQHTTRQFAVLALFTYQPINLHPSMANSKMDEVRLENDIMRSSPKTTTARPFALSVYCYVVFNASS